MRAYQTNSFPLEVNVVDTIDKLLDKLLTTVVDGTVSKVHGIYEITIRKEHSKNDRAASDTEDEYDFCYTLIICKKNTGCVEALHKKEDLNFTELCRHMEALKAISMLMVS